MGSLLKIQCQNQEFEAQPIKMDRKKIYGYTEIVATNEKVDVCKTAQIDPDGCLIDSMYMYFPKSDGNSFKGWSKSFL